MKKHNSNRTLLYSNYYGLLLIIFGILAFLVNETSIAATKNTFSIKQEMEFTSYDAAHWQTPITTYKGNMYFVWVDDRLRTMIAKKTPNGKTTTNVILNNSHKGKNHNLPSLGIDKFGYIHVAYNMHQSRYKIGDVGWQYKVSNKPGDISSFTFVGDTNRTIPGEKITYPSFTTDNNNELYVTFRHRTHRDGKYGYDGSQGIGIAKYNANQKRWSMLGGTNYKHGVKTFFWSDSSRNWSNKLPGYQGYRAKIFFDNNNRMHISWDVFINPGQEASHIFYAYSDNGGATFRKANGAVINSLPITPQNGDLVEQASKGIFDTRTYVAVTSSGRPIVSFEDRRVRKTYFKIWNGKNWGDKKSLPAASPANFTVDRNGVITAVGKGKFSRSWDNGKTWKAYNVGNEAESTAFDDTYHKQTGKLRFQTQIGNKVKVYTADFSGNKQQTDQQTGTLSPPTRLKFTQSIK